VESLRFHRLPGSGIGLLNDRAQTGLRRGSDRAQTGLRRGSDRAQTGLRQTNRALNPGRTGSKTIADSGQSMVSIDKENPKQLRVYTLLLKRAL
jgi:hypothetical protein